jgi:hypothetical protein
MNIAESEKYSEGSMKKAIIRIALEDLNNDGDKEILAYIIQFAWCGRDGGYYTFLVLQKEEGLWGRTKASVRFYESMVKRRGCFLL